MVENIEETAIDKAIKLFCKIIIGDSRNMSRIKNDSVNLIPNFAF